MILLCEFSSPDLYGDTKFLMQLGSLTAKPRDFPYLIWSVFLSQSFFSALTGARMCIFLCVCVHVYVWVVSVMPIRPYVISFLFLKLYCDYSIFSTAFINVVCFLEHWEYAIVKIIFSPNYIIY